MSFKKCSLFGHILRQLRVVVNTTRFGRRLSAQVESSDRGVGLSRFGEVGFILDGQYRKRVGELVE